MRGFAVQEATEVEESTLQKLEDLKQEYEVEVEQLGTDLAVRIDRSSPFPLFWLPMKTS